MPAHETGWSEIIKMNPLIREVNIIDSKRFYKYLIAAGVFLIHNLSLAMNLKDEDIFTAYNANAEYFSDEFTYDSLQSLLEDSDDYFIIAFIDSIPPVAAEVLLVKAGDDTKFIYMSSKLNRKLICSTGNSESFDLGFNLESPADDLMGVHIKYTVVEKRFNGKTERFSFDSSSPKVDEKLNVFRHEIFETMVSACKSYEVTDLIRR